MKAEEHAMKLSELVQEAIDLLEWTQDDDWWAEKGFTEERDAWLKKAAALLSTADSEQREWRGPVRCNKCSKVYATAPSVHYWNWNKHPYPRELCDGTFVPYERRASTRPAEQQEVAALRNEGDFLAIASERDEALRDVQQLHDAAVETEDKLASFSLVNASLRTALVLAEWGDRVYETDSALVPRFSYCPDCGNVSGLGHAADCRIAAALALPADSLAQEVVKYMEHKCGCELAESPGNNKPCTCGLDALLAKLGARP